MKNISLKRIVAFLAAAGLIWSHSGVVALGDSEKQSEINIQSVNSSDEQGWMTTFPINWKGEVLSRQLVLHYSGVSYKETLSHLENSLFASKEVDSFDLSDGLYSEILDGYDCVYVDESVLNAFDKQYVCEVLENYVYNGGSVFLPNGSVNFFDYGFLGIKDVVKLTEIPKAPVNMAKGTDMEELGEIVCDFVKLFEGYTDYEYFSKLDYGYGFVTSDARSIVNENGVCIYSMNNYGKGYVFLTNPVLPNDLNVNSFDRQQSYFSQMPFAGSTAGANALIKGEFASFVSKKKHGFSLERTFGSYGTQPISWQLHYEEITGIENDASIVFSEICKKYNQIPSFTLIRNTYKWFSRYESMSYLDIDYNVCSVDFKEGAYSNGTHVISDNTNLFTVEVENTGSYFEDLPSAKQRLFPCIYDVNADGLSDIVAGSSDGRIYVFETKSLENRWICKQSYIIKDENSNDIDVGSYSAPCVFDFDNDGIFDIISGDKQGNINFIRNKGGGVFDAPVVVSNIPSSESMPVFGDIDNDGVQELVVGSCEGKIYSFETANESFYDMKLIVEEKDETFMSPFVYDINNDGRNDLVSGTYFGYIRRYLNASSKLVPGGYIMANEPNYKGNNRVKFGNNCSPRFFDADGDGKNELVCGSYEYGLNVPIDSPYFPYKENLKKQVDYILNNGFYLGVHFYTNAFASPSRERAELVLHKNAFDAYGIPYEKVGVNQHTWYTSSNSNIQTINSVRNAGLLWDSGWQSSESSTAPQSSTENVLGFPAFTDKTKQMLVFNTSTLLYLDDSVTDITAKYGLPFSIYYHCDFAYNDKQAAENDVKHVADFVKRNNLSFVKEDQFAKMTAASDNINVKVRFMKDGTFTLIPVVESTAFPLYDKAYSDAAAVRMEVSVEDNIMKYSSDADYYFFDDKGLVITLNKDITLEKTQYLRADKSSHLAGANVPFKVMHGEGMTVLSFDDRSYVEVRVEGKAGCSTKGVTTEYDGKFTVFKGFGIKSLTVVYE